jgi:molybdopterin-guanine dinucleotide biosynthesis protein A
MGTDKAFVLLDGRTLLARMLDVARSLTAEVAIVGDPSKFAAFAPVIEDVFPGCGPLGGIHAALRASKTELNVILAVDIPFISTALVNYVLSRARNSDATVTLPRAAGGLQPLCAVYRRGFGKLADAALLTGKNKIDALFDETSTLVISEQEIKRAGFSSIDFRNLNTPQDLTSARDSDRPC